MSRPRVRFPKGRHRSRIGWTLLEVIVSVSIMATLATAAIMTFTTQIASAQKNQCKANMQIVESAKNAWVADHPGQSMATDGSSLKPYLRNQTLPTCPNSSGKYTYGDATTACTCSIHGSAY